MPQQPEVSVVIPAHNAMPHLHECLRSVESQTLGMDRIELVAVNDGSSDETGEVLDAFAARHPGRVEVVHQDASGAAGAPRNRGIEIANGRFIFFLDADDELGSKALQRMVAMADRHRTDVVLGRMEGTGGRGVPSSMFRRTEGRVDLFRSNIKYTLSAQKLFRRTLIEDNKLRFPEEITVGEDQPFTMEAYLLAEGISVIADYPCYFLRQHDGQHASKGKLICERFQAQRLLTDAIARHTEPGRKRDFLMHRPFSVTMPALFRVERYRWLTPEEWDLTWELGRPIVTDYYTEGVAQRVRCDQRIRLELVRRGERDLLIEHLRIPQRQVLQAQVYEHGRTYWSHPRFRDEEAGLPDWLFDMTWEVDNEPGLATTARGRTLRSSVRSLARRGLRKARRIVDGVG